MCPKEPLTIVDLFRLYGDTMKLSTELTISTHKVFVEFLNEDGMVCKMELSSHEWMYLISNGVEIDEE